MDKRKRLKKSHKAIIIKLLGAFFSPTEVKKELKEMHDIDISLPGISYYIKNFKDDIKIARERFLKEIDLIPIANKAYRIQERQRLINDIKRRGLWYENKTRQGSVLRSYHSLINQILDSAKSELEGVKLDISGTVTQKLEMITLEAERLALKVEGGGYAEKGMNSDV